MQFLVAYDVATVTPEGRKRLRRVAKICEGYGQRVQYSVFEVECSRTHYSQLLVALTDVIEPAEDSLRIYPLIGDAFSKVHKVGLVKELAMDEGWVL